MKLKIAFLDRSKKEAFLVILLFLFTFIASYLTFLKFQANRKAIQIQQENKLILPTNWSVIDQNSHDSLFRFGKDTDEKIKPVIVFSSVPYNKDAGLAGYLDTLISDTISTFPSFQYTTDNTLHQKETSTRHQLSGHYYSSDAKISLDQEIIIRQDKLYIITASYVYSQLNQADTNQVILTIIENLDLLTSPDLLLVY